MQKQLLILPFDHRNSLARDVLGADYKNLSPQEKEQMTQIREIIFAGFLKTIKNYPGEEKDFGILTDEEFGLPIIAKAKKLGVTVVVPVEKSGQKSFILEYGDDFGEHIKKVNPDYVKVLVNYNPQNKKGNKDQIIQLKRVDQFCQKNNYPFFFELLVPATDKDLEIAGSKENYDRSLRPKRAIKAIKELSRQLSVTMWKVEGFKDTRPWKKITKIVGPDTQIIVLGRGGRKKKVESWLKTAAQFEKIIGFAIGRTIFLKAITDWHQKKITKQRAIDQISQNFYHFVKLWKKEREVNNLS